MQQPDSPRGPRHRKAVAFAAVLTASIALAAPALGAFELLASFGATGDGPGTISPAAAAIAVDAAGRVYVADTKDGRVEAFANDGTPDGGWGGLDEPSGVAVAPDGTVVVADADGVRRYAADGSLVETLLTTPGWADDPAGLAVGPDGTVYVAQPSRHRVLVLGGTDLTGLAQPVAVAVAADGTAYVADHGDVHGDGRVYAFDADGAEISSWSAHDPHGIAVAPDSTVLVADEQESLVLRFGADGSADGDFGDSGLNNPHGVAADCSGRAYVVDNSALRVHVYGEGGDPPPCDEPPAPASPAPLADSAQTGGAPGGEVLPFYVAAEPEPMLGVRGRATPVAGDVVVGKGSKRHRLAKRELVPVGETIDAGDGRVKLEFETAPGADREKYGRYMEAEFYDGAFTISQGSSASLVDLNLLEEADTPAAAGKARASAAKKLKVWGNAKGRFRTVGRNGAATVLGTQWLTEERENGTLFRVREGTVQVRDFTTGKLIVLNAGDSYLAKPPCVSRRAFRIRLRVPAGATIVAARVTIDGKAVAVRRGTRLTAPVDLRGEPEGTVRVRIRVDTSDGRRLVGTRVYRTCRSTPVTPTHPPLL